VHIIEHLVDARREEVAMSRAGREGRTGRLDRCSNGGRRMDDDPVARARQRRDEREHREEMAGMRLRADDVGPGRLAPGVSPRFAG
jgi:hypothetical protein